MQYRRRKLGQNYSSNRVKAPSKRYATASGRNGTVSQGQTPKPLSNVSDPSSPGGPTTTKQVSRPRRSRAWTTISSNELGATPNDSTPPRMHTGATLGILGVGTRDERTDGCLETMRAGNTYRSSRGQGSSGTSW